MELTGQREETIRYMRLTVDLLNPNIQDSQTVVERGIRWANFFYDYPVTQLMNLQPGSDLILAHPFSGQPPPNLLLGYFRITSILNNYLFDQRTFSNISYHLRYNHELNEKRMLWYILTDCSYTVNTGAYARAIEDSDDFNETISNIQNAVLMDRVVSSLTIPEIRGLGSAIAHQNTHRFSNDHSNNSFSNIFQLEGTSIRDAEILTKICQVRKALINFISLSNSESDEEKVDIPFDDDWVSSVVNQLSCKDIPKSEYNIPFTEIATIMAIGKGGMKGGALTLRSGKRFPVRLRPRIGNMAITASIRRQQGRYIQRFIDRLPRRTRRVRSAAEPQGAEEPQLETPEHLEEVTSEIEEEESDESLSRPEESDIIMATLVNLLENLEEELSDNARNSVFFNFGRQFFTLLVRLQNVDMLTERTIKVWVMYFFIMEHLASTLFYLHNNIIANRVVRSNIGIHFTQVILRGRNDDGEQIFTRIWSERDATAFERLYTRIVTDLIGIVDTSGRDSSLAAPEERDQLLEDIQFSENSGDISEIIEQIRTPSSVIDSVELAFRIKFSGLVSYSTNYLIIHQSELSRREEIERWRRQQR